MRDRKKDTEKREKKKKRGRRGRRGDFRKEVRGKWRGRFWGNKWGRAMEGTASRVKRLEVEWEKRLTCVICPSVRT